MSRTSRPWKLFLATLTPRIVKDLNTTSYATFCLAEPCPLLSFLLSKLFYLSSIPRNHGQLRRNFLLICVTWLKQISQIPVLFGDREAPYNFDLFWFRLLTTLLILNWIISQSLHSSSILKCYHLLVNTLSIQLSAHRQYIWLSFHLSLNIWHAHHCVRVFCYHLKTWYPQGLDAISSMFKKCVHEFAPVSSKLCNRCIAFFCFAACWKSAYVIHICKNCGELSDPSDYWHNRCLLFGKGANLFHFSPVGCHPTLKNQVWHTFYPVTK